MNVTIVGRETADASRAAHGEAVSESTEKERVAVHWFTLMLKMRRKMASNKGGGETLTSKVIMGLPLFRPPSGVCSVDRLGSSGDAYDILLTIRRLTVVF